MEDYDSYPFIGIALQEGPENHCQIHIPDNMEQDTDEMQIQSEIYQQQQELQQLVPENQCQIQNPDNMKQETEDMEIQNEIYQQHIFCNTSFEIKQEQLDEHQQSNLFESQGPDNSSFFNSINDASIKVEDVDSTSQAELPENRKKQGKPRGRPKGAKNGTGKRPGPILYEIKHAADRLPKMHLNVHTLKLTAENIEELKKRDENFFQPGVCYQIAPKLDHCKECWLRTKKRAQQREVDCRFYQFRKLRFNGEEIEVDSFANPDTDPFEIDRNIWLPYVEKQGKQKFSHHKTSPQNARMILTHVGDEFCKLIEKEKVYLATYKSETKPIIWKRTIASVLEICDLCSTTLFNHHFICTKCGFGVCMDCIGESTDGQFNVSCSTKERTTHSFEDLSLTKIIAGDCMEKLQNMFHETCELWNINHCCEIRDEKTNTTCEPKTANLVKNLLFEMETGKSVVGRELPHKNATFDVDLKKLEIVSPKSSSNLDATLGDYFKKVRNTSISQLDCKPFRHCTSQDQANEISISRVMSHATSSMLYPDVPHKWLCENKLLRLLDPFHSGNESFFHEQWQRGQPVLVSNVLNHLQKELWIPQSFSAEFGHEQSDFVNCMNGRVVRNRQISTFWDGFENVDKRLKDQEGKPMLLKLKDWPPDSDFKKIMPTRFDDIMKNLPLNVYTNRSGDLNIVKYLPNCFLHPDLGPKGYFAYGSPFHLKEGTTNLHLDISDACNVIVYVGFPRDKNITIEEYLQQGFKAILEADCDIANVNRVIKDGEIPGAIWHIYEASDADRIRNFLLKLAQERGFKVDVNHDVIHDQNWYLDAELRARLYKEYNVRGYAIVQCLGDCIILPAGTPHQVRNIFSCIKIAEDFVSPQQVAHCILLSQQFRKLTKTHTNNEEKLNIKNVAYHSIKEAIATLAYLTKKKKLFYE